MSTEPQQTIIALREEIARLRAELEATHQARNHCETGLKAILQISHTVVMDWDLDKNQLHRVNSLESVMGYSDDEITPSIAWTRSTIHPDDLEHYDQALHDFLNGREELLRLDVRARHKDGTYRDIRGEAIAFRNKETGKPQRVMVSYRDVTPEKEATRALQASEQRHRLAAEAYEGITFEWDLRTGVFFRSGNITKVLGYSPEEVEPTLEWGRQRYHPEDVARFDQEWTQALASSCRHFATILRLRHKSGEYRWIRIHAIFERTRRGIARKVTGCYLDITDQYKAETALRLSEERYRLATEAIQGIVFDWNTITNELFRSSGVFRLLGYYPDDNKGILDWWISILHPEDRKPAFKAVLNFVRRGELHSSITFRARHRLGHYLHLDANYLAIRNEKGIAERVVGCITDLTPRILAEEAQIRAERNFHQLFHDVPLGLVVIGPDLRIVECNQSFATMLGYQNDELHNRHLGTLADMSEWSELQNRPHDDDLHFSWEKHLLRKDGSRFPIHIRGKMIRYQNLDVRCLFGIIEDLTFVKLAEQQNRELERHLQETQKIESLGVLAGGIAHDFNNLLTVIMGNLSLVRHDTPSLSPHYPALLQAEEAGNQAAELCKQMLAYAGRGKLENRPFNLSELVESSRALLSSAASKHHHLHFHLSSGLPSMAGDPSQVRQILLNLVQNAAEAIPCAGGVIDIHTGVQYLDENQLRDCLFAKDHPPGQYVWMEVRDTGMGMHDTILKRIFEPFFTTKFTGRGLGLAAVAGIVRNHKGMIQLSSSLQTGTSFKLFFPIDPSTARAVTTYIASPDTERNLTLNHGTILVVDDEPSVRMVLARLLAKRGFAVIEAENGNEAIEMVARHADALRLIILDLTMPQRDGLSALQELRSSQIHTPVIVISGYYSSELIPKLDDLQAHFISKPFSAQALMAVIDPMLSART